MNDANEAEALARPQVAAMNDRLGISVPVLDQGFVRVVDYMGGDAAIVQAARVSYGEGTKTVRDDRGLIRYLLRHRHTTPFEMVELKLHVRTPMDNWRQWIRHRTASVNEYSTRYSVAIDAAQKTDPAEWRAQSKGNRQGSGGHVTEWPKRDNEGGEWDGGPIDMVHVTDDPGEYLTFREEQLQAFAREVYEERLLFGVAREQARKDLPLSTYTEAYWKIDGHNLLNFLSLRCDPRAQKEIRAYANVIADIVEDWLPLTAEAFADYRRDALFLTGPEIRALRAMLGGQTFDPTDGEIEEAGLSRRETDELVAKLERLGMVVI